MGVYPWGIPHLTIIVGLLGQAKQVKRVTDLVSSRDKTVGGRGLLLPHWRSQGAWWWPRWRTADHALSVECAAASSSCDRRGGNSRTSSAYKWCRKNPLLPGARKSAEKQRQAPQAAPNSNSTCAWCWPSGASHQCTLAATRTKGCRQTNTGENCVQSAERQTNLLSVSVFYVVNTMPGHPPWKRGSCPVVRMARWSNERRHLVGTKKDGGWPPFRSPGSFGVHRGGEAKQISGMDSAALREQAPWAIPPCALQSSEAMQTTRRVWLLLWHACELPMAWPWQVDPQGEWKPPNNAQVLQSRSEV